VVTCQCTTSRDLGLPPQFLGPLSVLSRELNGLPKCSLAQPITQASHHSDYNLIAISHSCTSMLLVTQSTSCYSNQALALINRSSLLHFSFSRLAPQTTRLRLRQLNKPCCGLPGGRPCDPCAHRACLFSCGFNVVCLLGFQ
jgi:hypothetical protein